MNGIDIFQVSLKNGIAHVTNYKGSTSKRKAIGGREYSKLLRKKRSKFCNQQH